MSNKVTVSFVDVSIGKADGKNDLAPVSAKYTIRRGDKVVGRNTFIANFSGRSLRRLRSAESNGVYMDIERRATRRLVESFVLSAAILGDIKKDDVVTIKTKRDIMPVSPEIVNVVANLVDCSFIFVS
jgi:hypothetical protein